MSQGSSTCAFRARAFRKAFARCTLYTALYIIQLNVHAGHVLRTWRRGVGENPLGQISLIDRLTGWRVSESFQSRNCHLTDDSDKWQKRREPPLFLKSELWFRQDSGGKIYEIEFVHFGCRRIWSSLFRARSAEITWVFHELQYSGHVRLNSRTHLFSRSVYGRCEHWTSTAGWSCVLEWLHLLRRDRRSWSFTKTHLHLLVAPYYGNMVIEQQGEEDLHLTVWKGSGPL